MQRVPKPVLLTVMFLMLTSIGFAQEARSVSPTVVQPRRAVAVLSQDDQEPVVPPAPVASVPMASITAVDDGDIIPQTVPIGEPIYLSAKKAAYARKPGSIVWRIFPAERQLTSRTADGGEMLILGTGSAKGIRIVVQQIVTLNDKIDMQEVTITTEGGTPVVDPDKPDKPDVPPVDPPDNPPPQPDQLKAKITAVTNANLTAAQQGQKAAVALVFRNVAKQIGAGQIKTMEAVTRETANQMRTVLGLPQMPVWLKWRSAITDVLVADGRFQTPEEHVAVWNMIADVLDPK